MSKWTNAPAVVLVGAAGAVMIAMMLHIVADVFGKYLFNAPIDGTIEIASGYYMVMIVFFPFAYVTLKEGQIIVELFTLRMSARKVLWLDAAVGLVTVFYMALFTWKTAEEAIVRTAQREIWEAGTAAVAIWPSRWFIPVGCGVMAVYVLVRIHRDFRTRR